MDLNSSAELSSVSMQQTTEQQQINNNNSSGNINDARTRAGPIDQQQQSQQQNQQTNQQQQPQNQKPPYTITGILHYLQYEWHRFEVERQEWEVEKAEMSARIALLQGEKKSHENLRHDLIRRIKMLEYCLRMERAKYHKLKHGTDPPPVESLFSSDKPAQKQPQDENDKASENQQQEKNTAIQQVDDGFLNNNSSTITYGRELLKHYLQEIGYTDTIIDLRSNRVRSLLGIVDNNQSASNQQQEQSSQVPNINNASGNSSATSTSSSNSVDKMLGNNPDRVTKVVAYRNNRNENPESSSSKGNSTLLTKKSPFPTILSGKIAATCSAPTVRQLAEIRDDESSVLASFGFLYDHEGLKDPNRGDDDDDDDDDDDAPMDDVEEADRAASTASEYSYFDKECSDATAIIRQKLDLLNDGNTGATSPTTGDPNSMSQKRINANRRTAASNDLAQSNLSSNNPKNWCPQPEKNDIVDIGELASLTTLAADTGADDFRKKQWSNKYRLQSHFDGVRDIKFSEKNSLIVTASEDETIKLWHLTRPSSTGGKSRQTNLPPSINAINSMEASILDIEPLHTYRGHKSRVLTIAVFNDHIYSGAQDGEIIMWKLLQDPNSTDLYAKFDPTLLVCRFIGHEDAVWSIDIIENPKYEFLLCSASSDLTIKIWNASGQNNQPLLSIQLPSSPTCIVRMPAYNPTKSGIDLAVASCDGKIRLFDIATSLSESDAEFNNTQPVVTLECDESHRINSIVIHPTLPYLASADSNRSIKIWDLNSNSCKSTMVAHLEEVTSLACDPTGKYLLSASHDCSARLWLFEERACIQEITSHRKKFDEGIFAVAFHPNLSQFATAGADGLAKVFM